MRSAVVLPEPDGPTSTMNSPSCDVQVERVDGRHVGARIDARRLVVADVSHRPPSASRSSFAQAAAERVPRLAGAERVERAERRADDRRRVDDDERVRHAELGEPRFDGAAQEPRSRACIRPPPSATSAGSSTGSSRSSATRTSATTSSASRSTIPAATASSAACASTIGASSTNRRREMAPVCIASASSSGVCSPKCAGTSCSSAVRGPRPSSLRAAAQTAAPPTSWPPPQSPVIVAEGGKADLPAVRRERRGS